MSDGDIPNEAERQAREKTREKQIESGRPGEKNYTRPEDAALWDKIEKGQRRDQTAPANQTDEAASGRQLDANQAKGQREKKLEDHPPGEKSPSRPSDAAARDKIGKRRQVGQGDQAQAKKPTEPAQARENQRDPASSAAAPHDQLGTQGHRIIEETEVKLVNQKTGKLETVEKSRRTILPEVVIEGKPEAPASQSAPADQLILVGGDVAQYGSVADFMRGAYNSGNEKILQVARSLLKSGKSETDVARWVVEQRNLLKEAIRKDGPGLFKAAAEMRNQLKYGNKVGPDYDAVVASKVNKINMNPKLSEAEKAAEIAKIDEGIIQGVTKTSKEFNAAGSALRLVGVAAQVAGFALTAMTDSPASLPPLPVSKEKEIAIEKARLHFGIPANVNIDEHGHRKKSSYEQVDPLDVAHIGDESDQEMDEALWWLGVPITYHAYIPGGGGAKMTWTVPGR